MTKRGPCRPALVAVIIALTVTILWGCGSGEGNQTSDATSTPSSHGDQDPTTEEREGELSALTQRPDFQAASERMKACIEAAGFLRDGDATILKDGSRFRAIDLIQSGKPALYAVIEYMSASQRCEEESGVSALRRAAGLENKPLDASYVQKANAHAVAAAACLEGRGWTFNEPVTLHGVMYFEPALQPSEQDAYDLDEAECRQETASP
jgi:hypothetical protein